MVTLSVWAAGPSNPSQRPSPSCRPPGLDAEHPPKGPDPCAGREGSIAAPGNASFRSPHALGLPGIFAGAAELGGAEPAAPHKPGGLDQLLDRCWDAALERRLGKGEGGSCPESEEESSAPLGLNFSTLFRRSLRTRIRRIPGEPSGTAGQEQGWGGREGSNFP